MIKGGGVKRETPKTKNNTLQQELELEMEMKASSNSSNSDQNDDSTTILDYLDHILQRKVENEGNEDKINGDRNNPPNPPPPKDNGSNFKGNKINPRSGRRKTMMESTIVTWT